MALKTILLPYGYYPDPTKGRPVFNGSIFIGEPDLDPEAVANQKVITLRQESGDTPSASQPVATSSGGVPTFNGSPAEILVDGAYSIKVLNSQGAQVYYSASNNDSSDSIQNDLRYAPKFATVAAMTAASPVAVDGAAVDITAGMSVYTQGNISSNDGGGRRYIASVSGSGDGQVHHTAGNGLILLYQTDGEVTARSIGLTTGSSMSDELNTACPVIAAMGITRLVIDLATLDLAIDTDFAGLSLYGSETVISGAGRPQNYTEMRDCFLQGQRQGVTYPAQPEEATNSAKLLYRVASDRYFIMSKSPARDQGGIIVEMKKDIVTATNSLGGAAQLLRTTWVHNCTGIYSYRKVATTEIGVWSDYNVPASFLGHSGDDQQRQATARAASAQNDEIQYDTTIPESGEINVCILGTAAAPSCDVLVDGVVYASLEPSDWQDRIYIFPIQTAPGNHTISVKHTDAGGGTLRVLGINFTEIKDLIPGSVVDEWAAYRNIDLPRYVENDGAHDYAIHDADADLWGGSFHGGETASIQEFVLDREALAAPIFSDGALSAIGEIYIRQRTTIDWSGVGGGILDTESFTSFKDGQVQFDCTMMRDGASPTNMNVDRLYTSMHGMHEDFDRIIYPIDEAIVLDDGRTYLGNHSKIGLRHVASSSLIFSDHNLYEDHVGQSGGMELNRILGSYNKMYYGPVQRGLKAIDKVAFTARKTYK
jgi:hypothetical protein